MGRRRKGRDVHGWLVVDKPAGITSSAVVNKVRWAFDAKKAGHAGTLDPDATGVLAVALGEATKTVPYVTDADKHYRFRIAWGAETSTDDAAGEVVRTSEQRPDDQALADALPAFRGTIEQIPPQVSAVKVDGARAYDLARDGEVVELQSRPLHVASLEVVASDEDGAELAMTCGKGGYVRAIARDLGRALGCLGHVAWLRREWSGPFRVEEGVSLETLEAEARSPALDARLLPMELGLASLPELPCAMGDASRIANGNPGDVIRGVDYGAEAWASDHGRPVAIGIYRAGQLHPTRVFRF
ncbi:tRNA pseudouridine(55) synthase TruB [Jannaschia aquimarina]|uniref:tRNA pseudouridine synthase B n=1 Tax=Jannaschia aquimarina TaxID=935700 RepID=A0A0D1EF16_9RHOB|nr:tRNA pseudouridine(55) synthase TruB [Jannaschia aquimarina]KIT15486.1 tRNA pseudouridine synthase B [Jannaschia aquimarina]SNT34030.1 tRNA pseudouridine synthase B [Jannaschia aquimarina]